MSEMIKNFSKMMNGQEIPENVKNILNSMGNNNGNTENNCNNNNTNSNNHHDNNTSHNNNNNNNNIFENFDMNTILKIQKIMNSVNNDKQGDTRANLLRSLKPYLKDSRKNKVDQYIQLMKMGKIIEIMNPLGGDNKNV